WLEGDSRQLGRFAHCGIRSSENLRIPSSPPGTRLEVRHRYAYPRLSRGPESGARGQLVVLLPIHIIDTGPHYYVRIQSCDPLPGRARVATPPPLPDRSRRPVPPAPPTD